MLYEKALRNKKHIRDVVDSIERLKLGRQVKIMEVCGTHTYAFFRFGLRKLLSEYVDFISGPGCPVCITANSYVDSAILLSKSRKNVIATFGDMIRVKGTRSSLEAERAKGAHVLMIYSPLDALTFAQAHPKKNIIFLAIGFETTAPLIAATVKKAKQLRVKNFFILAGNRIIPPAMDALCQDKDIAIDGFICPGHVSVVIGLTPYKQIVSRYRKGCVISGFEPFDITFALYVLLRQLKEKKPAAVNAYRRVVRPGGNPHAKALLREVFRVGDAPWRGLGIMKKSGLFLNAKYKIFDARKFLHREIEEKPIRSGCLCAEVIKGKVKPYACLQFRNACSPLNPLGPCMVSFEGACRIYYEYRAEFDTMKNLKPVTGRKYG